MIGALKNGEAASHGSPTFDSINTLAVADDRNIVEPFIALMRHAVRDEIAKATAENPTGVPAQGGRNV